MITRKKSLFIMRCLRVSTHPFAARQISAAYHFCCWWLRRRTSDKMDPTGGMKDGKQTLAQRLRAVWMTANLTRAWRSTSTSKSEESTLSKQLRLRQSLEEAFDRLADSIEGIAPSHLYPLVYSTNKDVLRWCCALLEARSLSYTKDTLETIDFDAFKDDARGDDARDGACRGLKLVLSYCPVAVLVLSLIHI